MAVFGPCDMLLPGNPELEKWAVIACDQFTSDESYWAAARSIAAGQPSTINLILPEAELEKDNAEAIGQIHSNMEQYLEAGVFQTYPNSYIYVERTLENGSVRPGILGVIDLEEYDYHPGAVSRIRATESTVLERIPPRKAVRQGAALELPHVLLLCDDREQQLIEPIAAQKAQLQKLYDFDLMLSGGHIRGWLLDGKAAAAFDTRLEAYMASYEEKYPDLPQAKVLFAVGDGNHSLATAKSCYEDLKAQHPGQDFSSHPARYALVELENIHHDSQKFEPIHRIVTRTDPEALLAFLQQQEVPGGYEIEYMLGDRRGKLILDSSRGALPVAVLQEQLDHWLSTHSGTIDYIHGEASVIALAAKDDAIGFLLPAMEKGQLFRGVIADGSLPRKTFSMGHAREKRYYLEGRKIK